MISVNSNISIDKSIASLSQTSRDYTKTVQKLSTGSAINSAEDDASGLSVVNKMSAQIRGFGIAYRNIQDGISLVQTADGAMNEMMTMAQRMRELVVQSTTGTLGDADRASLDKEFQQLKMQMSSIVQKTQWNGIQLLGAQPKSFTNVIPALVTGTGPIDTSEPASGNYNLTINGFDVPVQLVQDEDRTSRLNKIVSSINQSANLHGATAEINQNEGLNIFTKDGSDLSVSYDSSINGLSGASFGLGGPGVAQQSTIDIVEQPQNYPQITTTNDYIEFSDHGDGGETISISSVSSPDTTNGTLSIVNGSVYKGNGLSSELIGSLDPTRNGTNGLPLRINYFKPSFVNGSFEDGLVNGSIPGWTTINQRIQLNGGSTIAGFPTPYDSTTPAHSHGETNFITGENFQATIETGDKSQGNQGLSLSTGDNLVIDSYGLAHGPALVSDDPVNLKAGDTVSFDWKAHNGVDDYDVFAYLLDVNTGNTVELLNDTGGITNWATKSVSVPATGDYKFVFVGGTFDATGGTAAGAQLYIDNVNVTPASPYIPTADDETALKSLVNYSDTTPFTVSATINGMAVTSDPDTTKAAAISSLKSKLDSLIAGGQIKDIQAIQNGDTITLQSTVPGKPFSVTQTSTTSYYRTLSSSTIVANQPEPDVEMMAHGVPATESVAQQVVEIQAGADQGQKILINLPGYGVPGGSIDALLSDINSDGISNVAIDTLQNAYVAQTALEAALEVIANDRATIGAQSNRLRYAFDNVDNMNINQKASRSQIQDTDYAKETAKLAKLQILQNAATSILAQANSLNSKTVLDLIKS